MASALNINEILSQVKRVDKAGQLTLLQRITDLVKRSEIDQAPSVCLTSLSGLGSEIWKSTKDIDDHIDGERQW
jgi:hypothetical protein